MKQLRKLHRTAPRVGFCAILRENFILAANCAEPAPKRAYEQNPPSVDALQLAELKSKSTCYHHHRRRKQRLVRVGQFVIPAFFLTDLNVVPLCRLAGCLLKPCNTGEFAKGGCHILGLKVSFFNVCW